MPTIIIASIIGIVVIAIIVNEIKKRKSGKCSCGCQTCAFKDKCNK